MISPAEFEQKLSGYKNEINFHLEQVLQKKEPALLYSPMRFALLSGGKRIRPILLLLTCEAIGGSYREALCAAVAVELLHNFTLIHDDVMDQDETRRGKPTVYKKWDVDIAILSGDGLVALSYEYLLKTKYDSLDCLGQLFSKALLELCEGQVLDKKFESSDDVTPEQYFAMIEKKTAALLALCCEIGGLIGGAEKKVISSLRQFGLNMGLAFQIQDDLLDIMADEQQIGKTWGSDIKRKKKTILLIQALKMADSANKREMNLILKKVNILNEDVYKMKDIFQRTGAIDFSQNLLDRHFQNAREDLHAIQSSQGKKNLELFLEKVIHRTY